MPYQYKPTGHLSQLWPSETVIKNLDILDEDFETPETVVELSEVIDNAFEQYNEMLPGNPKRKHCRNKLNEFITEYNERRGNHIYNFVK